MLKLGCMLDVDLPLGVARGAFASVLQTIELGARGFGFIVLEAIVSARVAVVHGRLGRGGIGGMGSRRRRRWRRRRRAGRLHQAATISPRSEHRSALDVGEAEPASGDSSGRGVLGPVARGTFNAMELLPVARAAVYIRASAATDRDAQEVVTVELSARLVVKLDCNLVVPVLLIDFDGR
jgi:hypothetical protein